MKTLLPIIAAAAMLDSCSDERAANPPPASSSYGQGDTQLYTGDSSGSMSGPGNN
jgi:hypothetical protein